MRFIVFEGLDGAGKSTQIKMLADYLMEQGKTVFSFHFPNMESKRFGELVARFLRGEFGENDKVNPYLVATIYAGDRFDAKEMLSEKLNKYDYVIVDRYVDSNIAYQCAKTSGIENRKALREWIYDVEYSLFCIPRPDCTIFFDVPVAFVEKKLSETRDGEDRKYLDGKKDIHESSMTFQQKVREVYIELFSSEKDHHIVNCASDNGSMKKPAEIFSSVKEIAEKVFKP